MKCFTVLCAYINVPSCRLVKELHFSVVVFDTAPTGHTLRFLSMPSLFEKGLGKVTQLKSHFGSLFSQVLSYKHMYKCI